MAKIDREGKPKLRGKYQHANERKVPALGYYTVITDTKATEKNFFEGLRDFRQKQYEGKLQLKVISTKTNKMIKEGEEIQKASPQFSLIWIIFDKDQNQNFDEIIKVAEQKKLHVGWSNPCFEIWMFAYFGEMPNVQGSQDCCKRFARIFKQKTGHKYVKSNKNIYPDLYNNGDELKAIKLASQKNARANTEEMKKPSEKNSVTTVYQLVDEIINITKKTVPSGF